jgi:tetratricopeptide (TPR) repeat protein
MKKPSFALPTILVLLIASSHLLSQRVAENDKVKEGIALSGKAYLLYDSGLFLKSNEIFKKAYSEDGDNKLALYMIAYSDYRLMEAGFAKAEESSFEKYFEEGERISLELSDAGGWTSEGKTLLAAVDMMKIAKSPMSAVSLSPKITQLLAEAQKADPMNPRAFLIGGIMKFNTPAAFGGSHKEAAGDFRKAVSIFEKSDPVNNKPTWGYLDALAWLGRSLEELDDFDSAKYIYQKALSVEPDFGWVKYRLLPALEKKIEAKK